MVSAYAPPGASLPDNAAYESFPNISEEDRPPLLLNVLGAGCMGASSRFASLFPCAAIDLNNTDDDCYAAPRFSRRPSCLHSTAPLGECFSRQDEWRITSTEKEKGERRDHWGAAVAEARGLSSRAAALERLSGECAANAASAPRNDAAVPAGHPAMAAEKDVSPEATAADDNSLVWDGASSGGSPGRDETARARGRGRARIVAVPPPVNSSDSDSGVVDAPPPLGSRGASEVSVEILPSPSPKSPPTKTRKVRFGRRLFGRKKKA